MLEHSSQAWADNLESSQAMIQSAQEKFKPEDALGALNQAYEIASQDSYNENELSKVSQEC